MSICLEPTSRGPIVRGHSSFRELGFLQYALMEPIQMIMEILVCLIYRNAVNESIG